MLSEHFSVHGEDNDGNKYLFESIETALKAKYLGLKELFSATGELLAFAKYDGQGWHLTEAGWNELTGKAGEP